MITGRTKLLPVYLLASLYIVVLVVHYGMHNHCTDWARLTKSLLGRSPQGSCCTDLRDSRAGYPFKTSGTEQQPDPALFSLFRPKTATTRNNATMLGNDAVSAVKGLHIIAHHCTIIIRPLCACDPAARSSSLPNCQGQQPRSGGAPRPPRSTNHHRRGNPLLAPPPYQALAVGQSAHVEL